MGFNRNIIQDDIRRLLDPGASNPVTLTSNPPSGFVPAPGPAVVAAVPVGAAVGSAGAVAPAGSPAGGGNVGQAAGGVTVPTEDSYLTKLLKYVPVEVLGAYLLMAGVIDNSVTDRHDQAIWLGGLLIGIVVLTIPYDRRVLNIARWGQVAMRVIGLAVYVFALGGWFATTTWYHQWYASLLVPAFGLLVAIFRLKPLPPDPNN
ncbi:MAG TPA: hypothetical protein VGI00_25220 [Streptosporangiaceae bacterium]|jgi:hypothetical protein